MTNFIRSPIDTLANYIKANTTTTASSAQLIQLIQNFQEANRFNTPLPEVKFDFENNKAHFMSELQKHPVWSDSNISATGQILIEFFAAVQTFDQFSTEMAARETTLAAMLPSSIYEIVRMLGVRVKRQIPSATPVTFTRTGNLTNSLEIPKFTKFTIDSSEYFSRDAINFNSNETTQSILLYEGSIKLSSFVASGSRFQSIKLNVGNFIVSDVDIYCYVGSREYKRTKTDQYTYTGLWEYGPDDEVFYEKTVSDGTVELIFGNGSFGKIPPINLPINIVYAVTSGADGNLILTNQTVTVANFSNVTGIVTGNSFGGQQNKLAKEYKILGPGVFAAKERMTTRKDHNSITVHKYPGIIDAKYLGQAEFAPQDKSFALVQQVILLTDPVWNLDPAYPQPEWNEFEKWYKKNCVANYEIIRRNAIKREYDISAKVFCLPDTELTTIQRKITAKIRKFFQYQVGSLGKSFFVSDVFNLLEKADPENVEFCWILPPTTDMIVGEYEYVSIVNIELDMNYTDRRT